MPTSTALTDHETAQSLSMPSSHRPLSPDDEQRLVVESAIAPDVIAERGYRTYTDSAAMQADGFSKTQAALVPALRIPIHMTSGKELVQARPRVPRVNDAGKVRKYEIPVGQGNVLDVHPRSRLRLGDPSAPLLITEGVRKADSALSNLPGYVPVALLSVDSWRGTNELGGKTALPDWNDIALNRRLCVIAFDSDLDEKPQVQRAAFALKAYLQTKDAHVAIVRLPAGPNSEKMGLDDFCRVQGADARAQFEALVSAAKTEGRTVTPVRTLTVDDHHLTDVGNGQRFAKTYADRVRFVGGDTWYFYDGTRWAPNKVGHVARFAKALAIEMHVEAVRSQAQNRDDLIRNAVRAESAWGIKAMIEMAKTEPELAMEGGLFDLDPWLLNVANGTLDLRVGELRPHNRDDMLSKICPVNYDPEAACPEWRAFLGRIFRVPGTTDPAGRTRGRPLRGGAPPGRPPREDVRRGAERHRHAARGAVRHRE